MSILAHDQGAFSKSFPTAQDTTKQFDRGFVVVGLFSLLGLCLSVLALMSGAGADLEAIVPFLG